MSTDATTTFSDVIVPLAAANYLTMEASLLSESLIHLTYKVQTFVLRAAELAGPLTPSETLTSVFWLQFGTEMTSRMTAGGSPGCLKWDAEPSEIQTELETFLGIDEVFVAREEVLLIPGVAGAGVAFRVTFTGTNVWGNILPLQVIDVGSNGCFDASNSGVTFDHVLDLTPGVVQETVTYVPFDKTQRSVDIPFDADARDVKAAIKNLSQACKVDVSRTANRHDHS